MCVKLPPRNLNLNPYPPHSTNIYTCRVTITLRVCGGIKIDNNVCYKNNITHYLQPNPIKTRVKYS